MPSPPQRTLAFVACSSTQEIVVMDFDRSRGALTELSRHVVPSNGPQISGSLPIVLSPDRRFLYASLRAEPFPTVSFAINPADGDLSPLGTSAIPERPAELITDRTGRFLFSVSFSGGILSVGPIEADGVAGNPTQVIRTPAQSHGVVIDPNNRHVYVACMAGVVQGYRFDAATGRLDETPFEEKEAAPGAGPRHLAFGKDARHLYAITEHHGTVIAYDRDVETGRLTKMQTVSMLPDQIMRSDFTATPREPPGAADIHVSADGKLLVASDRPTNSLGAFRIDPANGRLLPIGNIPGEPSPRTFAFASSGAFLISVGVTSGTVGVYAIDPSTSALKHKSSTKVAEIVDWVELADFPPRTA